MKVNEQHNYNNKKQVMVEFAVTGGDEVENRWNEITVFIKNENCNLIKSPDHTNNTSGSNKVK